MVLQRGEFVIIQPPCRIAKLAMITMAGMGQALANMWQVFGATPKKPAVVAIA
jgi:hypothetical protein